MKLDIRRSITACCFETERETERQSLGQSALLNCPQNSDSF